MSPSGILIRLAQAVPAVLSVMIVGFFLVQIAPGDAVYALAGEYGNESYYESMRQRFALDEPLPAQMVTYFRRLAQGDLGTSFVQGRPVMNIIGERVPATLLLTTSALFISTVIGLVLGVLSGVRPFGLRDLGITSMTIALYAAPVFWLAQLAILTVAFRVGWFPIHGMVSADAPATSLARVWDVFRHLTLPSLVLASQQMVAVSRLTRNGVIQQLGEPHVRTARAKGLTSHLVVTRHVTRLALLPVVTLVGHRVGHLLAGAVLVEIVFGWPGIGQLMLNAIQTRDIPVLLGLFLVVAFAVIIANLVTDLLYEPLDARVRYHRA